ncbi:MAG: hypothetical protein RLY87_775 [Chloroflexota bacterium]
MALAWHQHGRWQAHWVRGSTVHAPQVTLFHLALTLPKERTITLHVSGDERFEWYIDGVCHARGPERGDGSMWHYHTTTVTLAAGEHHFAALVWSLGDAAAYAQIGKSHGLIVAADGKNNALCATGIAPWRAKTLQSYTFTAPHQAWGTGANVVFDARLHPWDWQRGGGSDWQPVAKVYHGEDTLYDYELGSHKHLQPAPLPPQRYDLRGLGTVRYVDAASEQTAAATVVRKKTDNRSAHGAWQTLGQGGAPLTIPAHTSVRVIYDLGIYVCGYHRLVVSAGSGARVRMHWEESLSTNPKDYFRIKTNRNEVFGKYFAGVGDTFIADGSPQALHQPLWWQSGRYVEVLVTTAAEPLQIESIAIAETGYPFSFSSAFDSDDPRLKSVIPMMERVLQMCAHETYMDCPYYEQLMYVGDTRLEALATYVSTQDDRLPSKAIKLFHQSRLPNNLTQSRYPSRVQQIIPPFSLWWIGMLYDSAYWRGRSTEVQSMLPAMRGVLDTFLAGTQANGLVAPPAGWNFVDWVPGWEGGMPPHADRLPCATINWHIVYTLGLAADLEDHYGDPHMAQRWRGQAQAIAGALEHTLWDASAGVYREVPDGTLVSEHAQCLALLSGYAPDAHRTDMARALRERADFARTTIYFSHYLFEAYRQIGAIDLLIDRMQLWFDLPAQGLTTTVEMPEPTRSDCHAWGAHPLFHYHATIIGIRPAVPGASHVRITPQLGPLQRANATTPLAQGHITSAFWRDNGVMRGTVTLPAGVSGEIVLPSGIVKIPTGGTANL